MLVDVELAANGVFRSGKIHPLLLDKQSKPQPDPDGAAWDQVNELSSADFPERGVRVDEQGVLSLTPVP